MDKQIYFKYKGECRMEEKNFDNLEILYEEEGINLGESNKEFLKRALAHLEKKEKDISKKRGKIKKY